MTTTAAEPITRATLARACPLAPDAPVGTYVCVTTWTTGGGEWTDAVTAIGASEAAVRAAVAALRTDRQVVGGDDVVYRVVEEPPTEAERLARLVTETNALLVAINATTPDTPLVGISEGALTVTAHPHYAPIPDRPGYSRPIALDAEAAARYATTPAGERLYVAVLRYNDCRSPAQWQDVQNTALSVARRREG